MVKIDPCWPCEWTTSWWPIPHDTPTRFGRGSESGSAGGCTRALGGCYSRSECGSRIHRRTLKPPFEPDPDRHGARIDPSSGLRAPVGVYARSFYTRSVPPHPTGPSVPCGLPTGATHRSRAAAVTIVTRWYRPIRETQGERALRASRRTVVRWGRSARVSPAPRNDRDAMNPRPSWHIVPFGGFGCRRVLE